MHAITNVTIYDFHTFIKRGYVLFDQTIQAVGDMDDFSGEFDDIIDGTGMLLLPGLINGHDHIYSTFARGMQVDFHPETFQQLLEQLWWKLDRNVTNDTTYQSALISGIENVKHGVTTIIDHHASGEIKGSLDAINKGLSVVGLRKILCFETSDRFPIDACLKENRAYTDITSKKTAGLVGLHASFTLSDKTLQAVANTFLTEPIHIHVAESIEDQEHCLKEHNMRVIERLDSFGLIRPQSILVHGLYLNETELDIIKQNDAVVALNVTSNMNNAVGLPNYQQFKDKGIPVILGNDGINQQITTEYQALYYAMHHKGESPTAFGFDDLIDIINNTYQYASTQLGCKLGRISPGYEADFSLTQYNPPTPVTKDNIFGHLFFGVFNDFIPSDVFIAGDPVVSNYHTALDEQHIYQQARQATKFLWQRIEKEGMKQ